MRLPACFVLVLSLMAVSDFHAYAEEQAPVADHFAKLSAKLSSKDADTRREAADEIVEQWDHEERIARHGSSLSDASWQAFADAVIRKKRTLSPACDFVSAAHLAPEAHRRRLIKLASRLNPEASKKPTLKEIEALLLRELVTESNTDRYFTGEHVAIYGHMGMAPALKFLREGDPDVVDYSRGSTLLKTMAQPEDIPVLRRDLLKGRFYVGTALERLDSLGYTKAVDALVEAVRSGLPLEGRFVGALAGSSQRPRVAQALREWVDGRGQNMTEHDRGRVAYLLGTLESRIDIPLLEAWSSSCRDQTTLRKLGSALTKLGSVKGIDLLVRVVGERKVNRLHRKEPKDTGRPSDSEPNKRDPDHRWAWNRRQAIEPLNTVRVQLSDSEDDRGPWDYVGKSELDRTAPSVRAWWKKTKDRIHFDKKAGEWRFKSKSD